MSFIKNKTTFLLLTACVLVGVVFIFIIFNSLTNNGNIVSRFNSINPGITKESKVIDSYGKPAATDNSTLGKKISYNSPVLFQYDNVWSKNGVVVATQESLPDNTLVEKEVKVLGKNYDSLFDENIPENTWLVFYKKGVAIQTQGSFAYSFIRFAPQEKDTFLKNVAPFAGIVTKKPSDVFQEPLQAIPAP